MPSRTQSSRSQTAQDDNDDIEVHAVSVRSSMVSERTRMKQMKETANDLALSSGTEAFIDHQTLIGQHKPLASELSVIDGLLFK